MTRYATPEFDIDVDVATVLGTSTPLLIDSAWYGLAEPQAERAPRLQAKIERAFHNQVLRLQWQAAQQRDERRRALRVPLLSRIHVERGNALVACDISLSGLRCSGRPKSGLLNIEFKLPHLAFPVAARAEVVSFKDSAVVPLAGLRFIDIERPYVDCIQRYIAARRLDPRPKRRIL